MRAKVAQYRREGRLALRHMWFVILVFAVVQVIVSIAVAAANNQPGGYKSLTFAAIWSMFLVIGFSALGGQIVFQNRSSELVVGFMIGIASMLTELFFVLMCIFFIIGQEATDKAIATAPSDKAYGVFSLLNMIIYFVWTIILVVHRRTVMISQKDMDANNQKEFSSYDGSSSAPQETYNPTLSGGQHEEFEGDEQVL